MIYLDNAATSFPKPYAVSEAVKKYMLYCGGNPSRGAYRNAIEASEIVYRCREGLSRLFDASENVPFFTMNTTQGINLCIKGFLRRGDHVLISSVEHNSVFRPIYKLSERGHLSYDTFGVLRAERALDADEVLENIRKKVRKNTRMIICTASSNICSLRPPIEQIGSFCRERGIFFLVDGAQGAGHFNISVEKMRIDALCVPGHKGLLGPQGCGAVIFGRELRLETLHEGGNGVDSLQGAMPEYLPERYEAGTLPVPAIAGLCEGLEAICGVGLENIEAHERGLFARAKAGLESIGGVRVYCPECAGSTVLFSLEGVDCEKVAEELSRRDICVRAGYHCAPLAHKAIGTEGGAVRASFGIFNSESDADALCEALRDIKNRLKTV